VSSQVHDCVVHKLGVLLGSVGHRLKIHKITPAWGKERGDLDDRLPPPHTLIMDFTLTHIRFGLLDSYTVDDSDLT